MENKDIVSSDTNDDDNDREMEAWEIAYFEYIGINAKCNWDAHENIHQTCNGQENTFGVNNHVS